VIFAPKTTGSVSGKVTITSNAANSPNSVSIAGTGVSGTSGASGAGHSVTLSWQPSTSAGVTGYYVYRATVSGGPYARITGAETTAARYTDGSVVAGETYYYVVTALTLNGVESAHSGQIAAQVP
jgi:fibronectin type 3 domain-containing protein